MDHTTRRGNYDSGQDFVLEYGELRFTFNERDFAERCEQAACKLGFIAGPLPYAWAQVVNIKRDPFETSVGTQIKTLFGQAGALASPSTAYVYDWNLLPIGQALWLHELETYQEFPPMQDPASYNLSQVMNELKNQKNHPSQ